MPEIRAFGLWSSPITAQVLAEDRRLEAARWDSDGRTIVWLEGRSGRGVLLSRSSPDDAPREVAPELDVRGEVGYGGGDFAVARRHAYFVVHKTGRIFRRNLTGGPAVPITPAFGSAASPTVSPDGRWVAYIHHDEEQVDRLAIVDAEETHWPQVLHQGHDFYLQPAWSPDGRRIAWIAWDHPRMPWDGTLLYVAPVDLREGLLPRVGRPEVVAGGPEIAVQQPEFSSDGRRLFYISDQTGWSRLAQIDLATKTPQWLTPEGLEIGVPAWVQGLRSYGLSHDGQYLIAAAGQNGVQRMIRIDVATAENRAIDGLEQYGDFAQVSPSPVDDRFLVIAGGPQTPGRIIECSVVEKRSRIVARASAETVLPDELAPCEPLAWQSLDGETTHGLFFPPASTRFTGRGLPPLVVMIHGGPTSQTRAGWNPQAQFFATRGYAVLAVNYRGSTGYGRAFMLQLRGNWGVCDVEDAVSGVRHLAAAGRIDPAKTVILGGSAGGFTVLQTMIDHPEAFTAGICLYGVANQFHLAAETHKFEARYLDSLLGPLPEAAEIYRRRSPLLHAAKIRRPIAVFQGELDRVVPRQQSDSLVETLRRNGTPHIYRVFEGEGHGWRKRETIEQFYKEVEAFLQQYVVFS